MISIITITFNNFEELKATLESVANTERAESVVINGGGCEKTLKFLANYKGFSLSEKDRGISDAFNKGLANSKGEAVMYLNSGDILLDKGYLTWAQDIFDTRPDIDFTYSGIIYNDSNLGHVNVSASNAEARSIARGLPYPHQTLIIRKSIFDKLGGFDESFKFTMDFDLVLRMKKLGSKGLYYDKQLTVLMDGTGVSSKNNFKVICETYRAIRKNQLLTPAVLGRLSLSGGFCLVKSGLKKIRG